ncbi:MAG: hypothetical protein BMS9Abin07_0803 [Acidimicrobiia bacterium]|nr:MAG: hypothetical protein BMS9Abin07_0803 [Acidimicrobiia bacterium]
MRIISVAKAMLEEARATPCDTAGCEKFKNIYERTIAELHGVVSEELHTELTDLAVRFDDPAPSPSALRVAQAELVGWLDGLMNGIVIAVQSQFVEAQEQADAIQETVIDDRSMPGQYL